MQAAFEPQIEYSKAAFTWRAAGGQCCRQTAVRLRQTKLADPRKHLRIHRNVTISGRSLTSSKLPSAVLLRDVGPKQRRRMNTVDGANAAGNTASTRPR